MEDLHNQKGDTLYLKVYNLLRKKIENGELKNKIPSIRKMAKTLNVSNFTIIKAYELLEKDNYITSKKGSGFYISYSKQEIFYPEDHMENEDFKYSYFNENCEIDFSSASPKSNLFPIETLKETISKILDIEGEKALLYENPQGNIDFRKAIKSEVKKLGIETSIKNIQIISGAQQGINLISKVLIQNNDIVVTEDPTYKGAISSFKEKGARIKQITIEKDGLSIDKLEAFLKFNPIKLLYIIPIFQNPTGISISEEKIIKILELAKKHNFYIVEDDSNSELYFNKQLKPIKSYDKENRVIYIKSYSKVFMPGFRLGFMIIPENITSEIIRTKYFTDISTSGLNQRIFQYFMENQIWDKYTKNLRLEFYKKQDYLFNKLKTIKEITTYKPDGGLSFWIKLPKLVTGEAIYFKLLKDGISIIPGVVFSPNFTNHIRLSFAQCSYKEIDKGIEILKKRLEELILLNNKM